MFTRTVSTSVLAGILGCSIFAAAQDGAPATEVASAPRDYGTAFAVFHRLGLPQIPEGAEYVHLQTYSMYSQAQQSILDRIDMRQRAWMLPGGDDDRRTFVTMTGETMQVYDQDAVQKLMAKRATEDAEDDFFGGAMFMADGTFEGAVSGTWKKMDMAKEARKLADALSGKGKTNTGQPLEKDLSRYFGRNYMSAGPVLLAAVQYYGCGLTNEANEIAASAFTLAKDKRKVLMQAMSTLADSQYEMALRAFGESGNWQALHDELAVIHGRFKTAWDKASGLEILITKIAARIEQPAPAVDDAGLSQDDQKLIAALADARIDGKIRSLLMYSGGLQAALNPSIQKQLLLSGDGNALVQLSAKGIHAIPVLLAIQGDEYLMPVMARDLLQIGINSGMMSFSRSYGGSGEPQKTPEEVYAEMQRPLSRGDIATAFLTRLLPVSDEVMYGGESAAPEELAAAARTFYEAHGQKSLFELARTYMTEGNQQQRMMAGQVMMQSRSPKVADAMKDYFLADGESHEVSSKVVYLVQYASVNPDAAKPIAVELKKKLDEALKTQLAQFGEDKNMRKGLEQQFKMQHQQLDSIAGGQNVSLDAALANIATGKVDNVFGMNQVNVLLQKEEPEKALAAVLKHAVGTDNPTNRVALVSLGHMVSFRLGAGRNNPFMMGQQALDEKLFFDEHYADTIAKSVKEGGNADTSEGSASAAAAEDDAAPALKLSDFREQWEILLADDRPGTPAGMGNMYGANEGMQSQTVGDVTAGIIVAMGMQMAGTAQGYAGYYQHMSVLGPRLLPRLKEMARAILDGKTGDALPSMPSAENVAPAALTNLVKRLSALPVDKAADAVQKLDLDELLALHAALNDSPDLNRKFAEKAHLITKVDLGRLESLGAPLTGCKGAVLSSNVVETLLEVVQSGAKQGKRVVCTAARLPWFEGVSVKLVSIDDLEEGNPYRDIGMYGGFGGSFGMPQTTVQGMLQSAGGYGSATWTVEVAADAGKKDDGEAASQAFLSQLGVEAASKLTPDMLSQLMSQMGDDGPDMSEHYGEQQKKFWESVETLCGASNNVCVAAQVMFYSNIPRDGDEEIEEVMVIE